MRLLKLLFLPLFALSYQVYESDYSKMEDPLYWEDWMPEDLPEDYPWKVYNRTIFHNNKPFVVKGSSLNGFESGAKMILGLWDRKLSYYLDFLKNNNFNVVRLPMPYESMINLDLTIGGSVSADSLFYENMPVRKAIKVVLDEIHKRGMFAIVDQHTAHGRITEYPWDGEITGNDRVMAWLNFLGEFGTHPALMAAELLNEAHGECSLFELETWEGKVIYNIAKQIPEFKGLFFLGGVSYHGSAAWGGTFQSDNPKTYLMAFTGMDHPSPLCAIAGKGIVHRYVLSPHIYSVDVRGSGSLRENEDTWELTYGFLRSMANHWNQTAIVPTEIGGDMDSSSLNGAWYDKWRIWHSITKNITNGAVIWTTDGRFSDDTKGLLDAYGRPDQPKLQFMTLLVPNPTF